MQSNTENDELKHYGVLGMKWGVRRAGRKLYSPSSTQKQRDDAIRSLNKHRYKSNEKLKQLNRQNARLDSKRTKSQYKADKMRTKAQKGYATSIGEGLTEKRLKKMRKLDRRSIKYGRKITKNQRFQTMLQQNITNIDQALVMAGQSYMDD